MKGKPQCECSRCGLEKGAHDRNAGWWEMKPRGLTSRTTHWFCPTCSAALLVAVDATLSREKIELHIVVPKSLIAALAEFLEDIDRQRPPAALFGAHEVYRLHRMAAALRAFVPRTPVRSLSAGETGSAASTPRPKALTMQQRTLQLTGAGGFRNHLRSDGQLCNYVAVDRCGRCGWRGPPAALLPRHDQGTGSGTPPPG